MKHPNYPPNSGIKSIGEVMESDTIQSVTRRAQTVFTKLAQDVA